MAIIGAGSTGRAAADHAVECGLDVHVFDRFTINLPPRERLHLHHSTSVWGLFPGPFVAASHGNAPHMLDADAVLLANGGTDRVLSFPGSTLPGVMTSTGVLNLIQRWNVLPGQRFAIIGEGLVASHLHSVISEAEGHVVRMIREGEIATLEALGTTHVTGVRLPGETIDCDTVVLALGLMPDLSLATIAECELSFDESSQQWVVSRDDRLRTSSARIWAAGQSAGTSLPDRAEAEGSFAAASIAAELGLIDIDTLNDAQQHFFDGAAPAGPGEPAHHYAQPWTPNHSSPLRTSDSGLRIPDYGLRTPGPDVRQSRFICRCEEVTSDQIDAAIAAGSTSLNDLKRRTRAGMGLCQGAYCLPEMATILSTSLHRPLSAIAPMTVRPPVGGVSLAALAEASRVDDSMS